MGRARAALDARVGVHDRPARQSRSERSRRGLRHTQAVFTQPWLVLALAIASVLAAYHGLVRRRVAQTVGDVLLMAAMMLGGLWVIADPTGTVGVVGRLANQSSLGALSAIAQGSPSDGTARSRTARARCSRRALKAPGVTWSSATCAGAATRRSSTRGLHSAALKIAAGARGSIGCDLNNSFSTYVRLRAARKRTNMRAAPSCCARRERTANCSWHCRRAAPNATRSARQAGS